MAGGAITATSAPLRTTRISSPALTRLSSWEKVRAASVAVISTTTTPYQINQIHSEDRPPGRMRSASDPTLAINGKRSRHFAGADDRIAANAITAARAELATWFNPFLGLAALRFVT
jgi:hypothetical protein